MRRIYLIADNIRSAGNVGSILRTADGFAVEKVYLTGYTPYPHVVNDKRLPHHAAKTHKKIVKTSLGAEKSQKWQHVENLNEIIPHLKKNRIKLVALEQHKSAVPLNEFKLQSDIALILGNEISGVDKQHLAIVDHILQIPMSGKKESFNVTVSAAIALYHLRYMLGV